ncbi:MAG TPA: fibrobacter succinogenes major paralogous domain-containing protein [Hanamia sp.]
MKKISLSFTLAFLFIATSSNAQVTDIDGHQYKTVKIGTQVWMAENLNVSHFRNGDLIPEAKDNAAWVKIFKYGKPAWCNYNNDSGYGQKYGKLYNLNAVKDRRNLAPKGWHIPNDADWTTLTNYLGGWRLAGKKMKTTYGWVKATMGDNDRGNGTNESGFSALPTGSRNDDGKFGNGEVVKDQFATWWSSSKRDTYNSLPFNVDGGSGGFGDNDADKGCGFSIRCVKD